VCTTRSSTPNQGRATLDLFRNMKVFTIGVARRTKPTRVQNVTSPGRSSTKTPSTTRRWRRLHVRVPTRGTVTATAQYLKTDFEDAYKTNFNAGDGCQHHRTQRSEDGSTSRRLHAPGKVARGPRTAVRPVRDWNFAHCWYHEQTVSRSVVG